MINKGLKAEKNLLEMKKQKEEADRRLLNSEIVIGYISSITFFVLVFVASYIEMPSIVRALLIIFGSVVLVVGGHYA